MDTVSTAIAVLTCAFSEAGKAFSKKSGEAAFKKYSEFAKRLLAKVKAKATEDQSLKTTLDGVIADPTDAKLRNALDFQLRGACSQDPLFALNLEQILQEALESCGDSIIQIISVQNGSTATITGKNISHQ